MSALISTSGTLRLAVAIGLLISASGCVTYYQPMHGHDGFYHEGRHGPDVIVIERHSYSHFGPFWHPWWSVQWLYVDRPLMPQPLMPVADRQRPSPLMIEQRRAQGRIDRPARQRHLPISRASARPRVGTVSNAPRPTSTIHNRSPQRQAARPRPPRNQEP